jgi:geranylgeranyl reductase family protein
MDHEVIIVGAGPAGSAAAIVLGLAGRKVLLVDRHDFPRNKPCGDVIMPAGVKILHELGLKDEVQKARFRRFDTVRLVSAENRVLDVRIRPGDPGLVERVAPRYLLDELLRKRAVECGALFFRAHATGLLRENGAVRGIRVRAGGEVRELHSRVVIGADGSNSAIAAGLGEGRWNQDDAVAIRAYARRLKTIPETAEIHMSREIWPGYAWIFPAGDNRVNIGLGISIRGYLKMKRSLRFLLMNFLNSPGLRLRFGGDVVLEEIAAAGLRSYSPDRTRRAFDGAVLAGDAAALVNPWNGGGIINAMESGRIAAAVVDRALAENDVSRRRLMEYESILASSMLGELKACRWMKKWLYSPRAAEEVIRFIGMHKSVARLADRFYRDITVDVL